MHIAMKSYCEDFPSQSLYDRYGVTHHDTPSQVAPMTEADFDAVLESRSFKRWYGRNKRTINQLMVVAPAFAFTLFGLSDPLTQYIWHSIANSPPMVPSDDGMLPVVGQVAQSFFDSHGIILIHMLIIGFLTLVVTTFLKFTGRGDVIPLVTFVGGGVILYEVFGLFGDIYKGVMSFLQL